MSTKKTQFRPRMQGMKRMLTLFLVILLTGLAYDTLAQNWTGTGGKGMSITILAPQAIGLAKNQSYIPALVQGELVSNFSDYSAISVLDWEKRDAILVRLLSESYSDSVSAAAAQEVGNAIPTTHFMQGNITKTTTGYNLQMNITRTADKMTMATFSKPFTFAELDNLTGIRKASMELLQKVGVTLTAKAQEELTAAVAVNHVTAQTALAQGVTAQRQGTEVAALSYYFKAASAAPTMTEALKRSSILSANISSGNISDNIRNEIQWRKQWVDRLKETEEFFYNFFEAGSISPILSYLDTIIQGKINFQNETVTLSIGTYFNLDLHKWSFAGITLRTVWDGLNATKKAKDWGLDAWPQRCVTDLNTFEKRMKSFSVKFELVNSQNKVIGEQTLQIVSRVELTKFNNTNRPGFSLSGGGDYAVEFEKININDITDNMTIRVASVNGANAETVAKNGVLQIRAVSRKSEKGNFTDSRDKKSYRTVRIGTLRWMAQNLNYQANNSWCNENNASNCTKYGRLYTWDAAMSACPAGWRLPTRSEWMDLAWIAGGKVSGTKLKSKSPSWNGTDEYGFSALPGGGRDTSGRFGDGVGIGGYWWSATGDGSDGAWGWIMASIADYVFEHHFETGFGLSTLCVQE